MGNAFGAWSQDALNSMIHTRFRAFDEMTNTLTLVLVKVDRNDALPAGTVLLLRGPIWLTWREDDYTLQHAELGHLRVRLRPIDRDDDGVYYEAYRSPTTLH